MKLHRTVPIRYVLIVSPVVCLLLFLSGVWYIHSVDQKRAKAERESDRQWCELVVFYDNYYRDNPPTSDLSKRQAELMHRRRIALGCK